MINKLKAKASPRTQAGRNWTDHHHQSYSAVHEGEASQGRSVTSGWRRADLRPDYSKHQAARQSVGWINAAHLGTLVVVPLRCPGQAVVQAKCLNNRKRGGKITSQKVERKQIGSGRPFVAIQKVLMKLTPFAIARAQLLKAIELFFADKDPVSVQALAGNAREILEDRNTAVPCKCSPSSSARNTSPADATGKTRMPPTWPWRSTA